MKVSQQVERAVRLNVLKEFFEKTPEGFTLSDLMRETQRSYRAVQRDLESLRVGMKVPLVEEFRGPAKRWRHMKFVGAK